MIVQPMIFNPLTNQQRAKMNTETTVQEKKSDNFQSNDNNVSVAEFDLSNMILDRYKKRADMNDFQFKQLKDALVAVNSNEPVISID